MSNASMMPHRVSGTVHDKSVDTSVLSDVQILPSGIVPGLISGGVSMVTLDDTRLLPFGLVSGAVDDKSVSGWPFTNATITVDPSGDADHTTIVAALTAASAGDVILVGAGTYSETLAINKNVTLRGVARDDVVITGTGISVVTITLAGVVLEDLTITSTFNNAVSSVQGLITTRACIIRNVKVDMTGVVAAFNAYAIRVSDPSAVLDRCECYGSSVATVSSRALYDTSNGTTIVVGGKYDHVGGGGGTDEDVNQTNGIMQLFGPELSNNVLTITSGTVTGEFFDGNGVKRFVEDTTPADGEVPIWNAANSRWQPTAPLAPHDILDGSVHTDSVADAVTKGSIIAGNSDPKWDELPVGTDDYVLTADAAQTFGIKWAAAPSGPSGVDPAGHTHSKLVASDGAPDPSLSADASGYLTAAVQPVFLATNSVADLNVTGDTTIYTIVCDNEIADRNSNYNIGTGVFTAPVTGRYLLCCQVGITGLTSSHTSGYYSIITSNRFYYPFYGNPWAIALATTFITGGSVIADMDASDISYVTVYVAGGAKVVDVSVNTIFSGYLLL